MTEPRHEYFMDKAIEQARIAYDNGEIPVGCVIVLNDKIISKGHNMVEQLKDSTAHGEIISMTSAFASLNNKYLFNSTIYCTLEPCMMCLGAIINAKIKSLVFGAKDNSSSPELTNSNYSKNLEIIKGIRENECKHLLDSFFLNIRN